MKKDICKSERLLQTVNYLFTRPDGVTRSELAREMKVHRSTICRDLPALTNIYCVYEEDNGLIKINRDKYLYHITLNIHEIESLHLAYRLFAGKMRFPYPHAAWTLRKIAHAVDKSSPILKRILEKTADMAELADFPEFANNYKEVIEKITLAVSNCRRILVKYYSSRRGEIREYLLEPYWLEPYAEGNSVYLFAGRKDQSGLHFYKIERIREIKITEENYSPDYDLFPEDNIKTAWGIWSREDGETDLVRLRFSSVVAGRVKETVWHTGQKITENPDGSLIWEARVAEPLEMYPWIRGWGSDVEILEPEAVRKWFLEDLEKLNRIYF